MPHAREFATYPTLRDRTVLVTGGGSGIGAAIVEHFAEQGAKVAFMDIDEAAGIALADRLKGAAHPPVFLRADLRDLAMLSTAIGAARERLGPIAVLVNNAARDDRHAIESVTPEMWEELMAVNLRHQFFCAQAVREDMAAAHGGSIINLGSVSWMWAIPGLPVYLAAKAGVAGLTRALAREFGVYGIRVNSVVPGWVATERQKRLWMTPEAVRRTLERQCIAEILQPADIARMVLFLAADDSRLCTAQNFIVDAGAT